MSLVKLESQVQNSKAEMHNAVLAEKEAVIQQLRKNLEEQQKHQAYQPSHFQEESKGEVTAESLVFLAEPAQDTAEGELTAAQHQVDKVKK